MPPPTIHDLPSVRNLEAATVVPPATQFLTAEDEFGELMLFYIGTDGKFRLLRKGGDGKRHNFDFGAALRVKASFQITSFNLHQRFDRTIFLVLSSVKAGNPAIALLRPFKPEEILVPNVNNRVPERLIPSWIADEKINQICQIFLVSAVGLLEFGLLVNSGSLRAPRQKHRITRQLSSHTSHMGTGLSTWRGLCP